MSVNLNTVDFESIRPYNDSEVKEAIARLCSVPYFHRIIAFLFPNVPTQAILDKLAQVETVDQFQSAFILPFLNGLEKKTTNGITISGTENVVPGQSYLFMTNHRDIILDSAFLNYKLYDSNFKTTEIGIGDNLLIYEWITDLVKLNKSFVVKRNLPVRQMMEASQTLSAYMRHSVADCNKNLWISHREGRTKDGNDRTQASVLKMLNLSGGDDIVKAFAELHILPVAISYEFDPTDYLKAYQFQLKRDDPSYKKSQQDDLDHMNMGLQGQKGRVHFALGKPITEEDLKPLAGLNKNMFMNAMCEMIDKQIHANFKLWPGNYVAYDLLNNTTEMSANYTPDEKETYMAYVDEHMSHLPQCDTEYVRTQIYTMFANPVVNKKNVQ
ncbi:MAG: 1-acyl-sn-glycerol-3-phosphate acyltransferase [Bacteroidales bacterium]|nr:1-acyl-sn-glycerol-3-phosphate acyltransferase [Bacteroidales bacterium]